MSFASASRPTSLSFAAAYIQQQDFYGQASWDMSTFANEKLLPCDTYLPPTKVDTAVNAIWKANTLMTPIGGGVNTTSQNVPGWHRQGCSQIQT